MLVTYQAATTKGVTMKSWACPCFGLPVPVKVHGELSRVRLPGAHAGWASPGPCPQGSDSGAVQVACALVGMGLLHTHATGRSSSNGATASSGAQLALDGGDSGGTRGEYGLVAKATGAAGGSCHGHWVSVECGHR